jgi:hypothetical protein
MAQQSLEPTPPTAPSPRTSGSTTARAGSRDRLKSALEHERAAMLAEFNGTYELAKEHREAAARLRRTVGEIDTP